MEERIEEGNDPSITAAVAMKTSPMVSTPQNGSVNVSTRKSKLSLLREKSFAPTTSVNPFVLSERNTSKYNQAKAYLLFPLVVIRLVFCIFICLSCALLCRLLLMGFPAPSADCADPEMSWIRRKTINLIVRVHCRVFLFVMGFYWISVKGSPDRTCKMMIANHTTMVDVVVLLYVCAPSFLSKSTVLQVPLIGSICRAMQVIGVDRFNPKDKLRTRTKMVNYLAHTSAHQPPLLIFPEGTTSRYDTVMRFKPGAFDFAERIQPVLLHWRFKHYDPSSVATAPVKSWLYGMLSQFVHHVEVEYLDVLTPQKEELQNALFFARNAQRLVQRALAKRASKETKWCISTGFEHEVYSVSCNVDDFLVWKWFLRSAIPEIKYTLLTYNLESIRDVLGLVTPMQTGRVDLPIILQVAERYSRIWHSSVLPHEHVNKSLLSYSDLMSCVLKDQAGAVAKDIFISAFSEACLFQTNIPTSTKSNGGNTSQFTAEKFDFRQFTTALIWLSPIRAVWGSKYAILEEPYRSDAGVLKWLTCRARIVFAYICSHQPLRDDIMRTDIVQFWKQDGGLVLWDLVFGSAELEGDAIDAAAGGGAEEDSLTVAMGARLNVAEFREAIINGILSDATLEQGDQAHRARQVACLDLIDFFFTKIDMDFTQAYYAEGSLFLKDGDVLHRQVSEQDVNAATTNNDEGNTQQEEAQV